MSEDLQALVEEIVADPAVVEAPSMDDTMNAVMADIEARETETPEARAERARDEAGRFTKAAEAAAKPADVKAAADPKAPAQPAGEFQDRGPPTTWRAGAKAMWNGVDPALKAEIYKREQDAFNGIQQYQGKAQVADALMGAIQPYRPIIDALGSDIPGALNEVLRTASIFHIGTPEQKAATLRTLAQRHGVDLGTVNNGQPEQFRDPTIEALQARIDKTERELAGYRQASQNSVWEVANGEISAFQADPANKYFVDVAADMGRLMQAGLAVSMKEAYEKACHLNPQVKSALEIERNQTQVAERARQAAAARRAGDLSVRSSPTPRPVTTPGKGWQDAMEDYHAQIVSRDAA